MMELRLKQIRDLGWSVAIHNDYVLNGNDMSFWLFTHKHSGRFVRGEGKTDDAALYECLRQIKEINW